MLEKKSIENKTTMVWLFIGLAYLFSIAVRMYWPMYFEDNMTMHYANQLMINTNDGYYFSSAARDILNGIVQADHQRESAYHVSPGLVLLTAYMTKLTPFALETVTLYLPAIISSLIVVPIVLTGRLIGHTFVGFLAALLGSIAWSYYNRTMTGYYDTDMFSVLLQFTIFYGFLSIIYQKNIKNILFTAFFILIYPYFYSQGVSIVLVVYMFAMVFLSLEYFGVLQIKETRDFKDNDVVFFASVILLSIILMLGIAIEIRVALFFGMLLFLYRVRIDKKLWIYLALASFLFFLFYGNILSLIVGKISVYVDRGVESNGLHFYQVIQTVREAGSIPMKTVANRISGSSLGLLLSLIGYVVLVMRHKPFLVAMPLIGVGLFSYVGGLRFTVYAVPVVAISIVYLFYIVGRYFKDNRTRNIFMIVATTAMLYPNFTHILEYKVPTVLNNAEVQDLKKLQSISHPKDYTLAWWDYGYPIWFYSNTNTLIDGGKHTKDNFVVSKILQTTSPVLAANLGRVAVETYVDTNYTIVGDTLFKNGKKDQVDPNFLLSEIETDSYILPTKTRDVYLYLPYRMLNIFPTVALFGNLDLMTGKAERKMNFYPTEAVANVSNVIKFRNGIRFNTQDGNVILGQQVVPVKYFIVTQNTQNEKIQLHSQLYHTDGKFAVVYMKSYNRFVIMDIETFKSMYVQMFILGKYDKNLFELVVSSPYSRIYKIKK